METFALLLQLVSLLADYEGIRSGKKGNEYNEFLEHLTRRGMEDLRSQIEKNQVTAISIKAILAEDRKAVMGKLTSIERNLALLVQNEAGFGQLALSIRPDSAISEQALAILVDFERGNRGKALEHKMMRGAHLLYLDGESGGFEPSEPRLFEADVSELIDRGMLTYTLNKRGERVLQLTRYGAKVGSMALKAGLTA